MRSNLDGGHFGGPYSFSPEPIPNYLNIMKEDDNPTREEQGELIFQQIRNLMEDGHSQTLTKAHAREIISMATLILID